MRSYLQHGRRHAIGGSDPIPGLGGVAAAVANLTGSTSSISSGGFTNVAFTSFSTTDSSIFGTGTTVAATFRNSSGDTFLYGTGLGFYLAFGLTSWSSSAAGVVAEFSDTGSQWDLNVLGAVNQPFEVVSSITPSGGTIGPASFRMFYVDSLDTPLVTRLSVHNGDSTSHSVLGATIAVYYIAAPTVDLVNVY